LALLFCVVCALAQERQRHFELKANSKQFWKLVRKDARLEKIAGGMGFTEVPVWDPNGFVYVSDEVYNKILRIYPDGRKEELISLGDPDGNTYDGEHRLIDCASVLRAVIRIKPDGTFTVLADHYERKRFNSPNDVVTTGRSNLFHRSDIRLAERSKAGTRFQGRILAGCERRSPVTHKRAVRTQWACLLS
jgi:gluconolactonase